MNWIKKYEPKRVDEIIGQGEAILKIKKYLDSFEKQNIKKYALLYGPTGCGKTSTVYAISNQYNYDVLELNASESRNQKAISNILNSALEQRSLLFKKRLILIDELDGLSSTKDRGGISYLMKLISRLNTPIILVCNDPFVQKFSKIRKKSTLIEFKTLSTNDIIKILNRIIKNEKIECSQEILKKIARISGGDARSAINDLWMLSVNNKKITNADLSIISYRDRKDTIYNALVKIFKSSSIDTAIDSFNTIDELADETILWIDENIPLEYKQPIEIKKAYNWLSLADIFNSQIKRRQYWRLLVYVILYMTGGINISKNEKHIGFVKYKEPTIKLKMWIYNNKTKKINDILSRFTSVSHLSTRTLRQEVYPYLKIILKNKKFKEDIMKEFNLTNEDINYLIK